MSCKKALLLGVYGDLNSRSDLAGTAVRPGARGLERLLGAEGVPGFRGFQGVLGKWAYGFSTHCFKGWPQNLRTLRSGCAMPL